MKSGFCLLFMILLISKLLQLDGSNAHGAARRPPGWRFRARAERPVLAWLIRWRAKYQTVGGRCVLRNSVSASSEDCACSRWKAWAGRQMMLIKLFFVFCHHISLLLFPVAYNGWIRPPADSSNTPMLVVRIDARVVSTMMLDASSPLPPMARTIT